MASLLDQIVNNLKQFGAGAAEVVTSSPEARKDMPGVGAMMPSGVYALPALAELAISALPFETPYDGGKGKFTRYLRSTANNVNNMVGISDPQNTAETLYRVSGNALVPGPKLPTSSSALGKAGQVATEMVLPGAQTRSIPMLATSVAVPGAAGDAIAEIVDPNYQSAVVPEQNKAPQGQTATRQQTTPFTNVLSAIDGPPIQNAAQPQSADPFAGILGAIDNPNQPILDAVDAQNESGIIDALTSKEAVVGALGAIGLAFGGRQLAKTRTWQRAAEAASELTGKAPNGDSITGIGSRIAGATIDRNIPLFSAAETALKSTGNATKDAVELFKAKWINRTTSGAAGDSFIDFANTGAFPNSNVRAPRMAPLYEAAAQLAPEKMGELRDLITARARMSQMMQQQSNVWGTHTYGSLDQMSQDILQRSPELGKFADDLFSITNAFPDYMLQRGFIDSATHAKFKDLQYAPLQRGEEITSLLDDVLGPPDSIGSMAREATSTPNLQRRGQLAKGDTVDVGEVRDPLSATLEYAQRVLRAVELNDARKDVLGLLQSSPETRGIIRPSSNAAGSDVVTVRNNGAIEHFHVTDPSVRIALDQAPQMVVPVLNSARIMLQQALTGKYNPFFVAKSLGYEGTASAVNYPGVASPLRPSAIVDPFTAESMLGRANNIDIASYLDPQAIAQMGGPQAAQAMSNTLMRNYEMNAHRLFQRFGGGASPSLDPQSQARVSSLVDRVAPNYATATDETWKQFGRSIGNSRVARAYNQLMETAYNTVRASTFKGEYDVGRAAILADPQASTADILEASDYFAQRAFRSRTATGDAQAVPGSAIAQVVGQTIPYWQRSIIGTKAYVDALRDAPAGTTAKITAMTAAALGLAYTQYRENPEAFQKYMQNTTPEQRMGALGIIGDDGELKGAVVMDQPLQVVVAPLVEMFNQMYMSQYDTSNDPQHPQYEGNKALIDGLARTFGYDPTEKQVEAMSRVGERAASNVVPLSTPAAMQLYNAVVLGKRTLPDGTVIDAPQDRLFASGNRNANSEIGGYVSNLLSTLIPAASAPLMGALTEAARVQDGAGFDAKVGAVLNGAGAGIKEMNPNTGDLFSSADRLHTRNNPTASLLREKGDGIQIIRKNLATMRAANDPQRGDFAQYTPLPDIHDPQLLTILGVTNELAPIESQYSKARANMRRQYDAMDGSKSFVNVQEQRKAMNEVVDRMNELDRRYYDVMVNAEDIISKQLGRPFSFEHFDIKDFRK